MISAFFKSWFKGVSFPITTAMTRRKLRRHGGLIRGDVLDIGAGDQPYRSLLDNVASYTATNTGRCYAPEERKRLEAFTDVWVEGHGPLPFPPSSFDTILCLQVLSVIPDPAAFFGECRRLLRPGGRLVLTTDFLYPKWSPEDVLRHTDVHLRRLAEQSGFTVDVLEGYGGVHTMRHACLNRYIKDYPQRLRAAVGGRLRFGAVLRCLGYLLLLPFHGLAGRLIYAWEKDRNGESAFTANHLLIARKREEEPGARTC